jgi:predicted acetyltransferase
MALKLLPYTEIKLRDLHALKDMLEDADTTEFIDGGRAKITEYEDFTYILYKDEIIGYFGTRKLHIGEICWLDQHIGDNPEEYMVMAPMYIVPEFRSIGIGRNVMKQYYSNKKGLVWVDEENVASQQMVIYAGFVHYNDGYYVKSL